MENVELTQSESIIEKAKISESENEGQFMNPAPRTKKSRGRPKKEKSENLFSGEKQENKSQDTGPRIETKVLCYPIVKVISNVSVTVVKDKRAAMTFEEADSIAESMGKVFDKYIPELLGNYGAEMAFALAVGSYSTRLYLLAQAKKKEVEMMQAASTAQKAQEQQRDSSSVDMNKLDSDEIMSQSVI